MIKYIISISVVCVPLDQQWFLSPLLSSLSLSLSGQRPVLLNKTLDTPIHVKKIGSFQFSVSSFIKIGYQIWLLWWGYISDTQKCCCYIHSSTWSYIFRVSCHSLLATFPRTPVSPPLRQWPCLIHLATTLRASPETPARWLMASSTDC